MQSAFRQYRTVLLASLISSVLALTACGGGTTTDGTTTGGTTTSGGTTTTGGTTSTPSGTTSTPGGTTGTTSGGTTTTAPAPVTTATLSWTAPAGTVTGYRVYYGTSPRQYSQPLGSGILVQSTNYTVSGLTAGQTYYFAVTAIDAAGVESAYSTEGSKVMQ